jgi:hypothetical protein
MMNPRRGLVASAAIEQLVKDELGHYPGVTLEMRNGGKHDRAVFHLGERSRFVTLPKTPSDHRAELNIRRDVKKTLKELGVERAYHKLDGRAGRRHRNAVAAVALNSKNLVLLIPVGSKLLERFKTADGKAKSAWEFEIRASADLSAPPLIAVREVEMPPGILKKWGVTRGTMHKTGGWQLGVSRTSIPALTKKVDSISSVDVELYQDNGSELVFKLPAGTVPTSYHPHKDKLQDEPRPIEAKAPEPQAPPPAPATPAAPTAAPAAFPTSLKLELPKSNEFTIERAIRYLNRQKLALGNKLRFTVNEGGTLSAVHRIE